jgi:hypothetical protein
MDTLSVVQQLDILKVGIGSNVCRNLLTMLVAVRGRGRLLHGALGHQVGVPILLLAPLVK